MKNYLFIPILILVMNGFAKAQNIWSSKNASISFFSSTVVEDIEGKSNTASSALDIKSGNMIFKVYNNSFQFKKKLMQEHFNENYMESEKYPISEFKGRIIEPLDLSKPGSRKVTVEGNLTIHGLSKTYRTTADLVTENGAMTAKAVFKVKIADHNIEIPSLVFKNIAEFVEVRILATYFPKK